MKPFAERLREDERLVILRLLARQISYKANSSVLTFAMDNLGHAIARDTVKTHLHWLTEQALVSIEEPVEGVLVATLTERGHDVARGRAVVPGVARPGA
jgi:DNA-binding transcriptional ArsR family regulator